LFVWKNSATSSNFTLIPLFPQPVQGPCPEGIRYPFGPSSRKVASGQFSHQYPRICITRPHPIHMTFRQFLTLTFRRFLTLRPGTIF
jgi:hypothetical protein